MAHAKILKDGKTNINSTDISDFAFHSDYKTLKIHKTDNITVVAPANSTSVSKTIYHGLGYQPNIFVYVEYDGKLYEAYGGTTCAVDVPALYYGSDWPQDMYAFVSMNTSNLYVEIEFLDQTGNTKLKYNTTFKIHYFIQLDQE